MGVVRTAIAMVVGWCLPLAVQLWDRRRLSAAEHRRVWGYATWGASIFWLGVFTMLGWSWVTRRSYARYLWGPAWLGALTAVSHSIDIGVHAAFGESLEGWYEGYLGAALIVPVGIGILVAVKLITTAWRWFKATGARLLIPGRTLGMLFGICVLCAPAEARALERFGHDRDNPLPPGRDGWAHAGLGGIRGITIGPIENKLHPHVGYGTPAGRAATAEAAKMGASWVAITPFGRVWDLRGGGVDLMFEEEPRKNADDVLAAIRDAHEEGLRVMLVPHLWVETGGWRAQIDPPTEAGWVRWAASYRRFILHWADIAERGGADMLSVGVELRSWVTTPRAASFADIVSDVRSHYSGLLTYSGNWDDIEHTVVWGDLDVIGVNAFFPLTKKENATLADLRLGGLQVAAGLEVLATEWDKPVVLTEMGYTTRPDPALRPWEWPDDMEDVQVDEHAQAIAYRALLLPLFEQPWCAGFFAWRTYADPADVSQEAEWGFSPRGKLAELELRDAFTSRWAADPSDLWASWAAVDVELRAHRYGAQRARTPGRHAWELSPPLSAFMRD